MKRTSLDIYLTTFLGVRNFKNTSVLRAMFSLKMFKIESKLENAKRNWENTFFFWNNSIWKCCYKFSLLIRKYLLPVVNGLANSPEIFHIPQRDFFNLNFVHRDQKIRQRCCCSALNSVFARLPCYLWKGPLKRLFLVIYLTTFFGAFKFKNTFKIWGLYLFWKCSKLNLTLEKWENS